MSDACPAPDLKDALVQGLLDSTDCNVRTLVEAGYGSLFAPGGRFGEVLTALLVVYVALVGLQLMLGRGPLSAGQVVVNAVKIGAVLALATQWSIYSLLVYRLVFDGPQELASALQHTLAGRGGSGGGDVFAGLQHAFDDLTAFSPAAPPGPHHRDPFAAAALPTTQLATLTKPSFDAVLLLASAAVLMTSTLVPLLAARIVVGVLLALGPVFVALLLFESTRGVCLGWLRATIAFALTPLLITLTLGLGLTLLAPSLAQVEQMLDSDAYVPGVATTIFVLVSILAMVSFGLGAAAGAVALGLRWPRRRSASARTPVRAPPSPVDPQVADRPDRTLGMTEAIARQDAVAQRRTSGIRTAVENAAEVRSGAAVRRSSGPPRVRVRPSPRR